MVQTGDRRREHRVSHFWRTYFQTRATSHWPWEQSQAQHITEEDETPAGSGQPEGAAAWNPHPAQVAAFPEPPSLPKGRNLQRQPIPQSPGNSLPKRQFFFLLNLPPRSFSPNWDFHNVLAPILALEQSCPNETLIHHSSALRFQSSAPGSQGWSWSFWDPDWSSNPAPPSESRGASVSFIYKMGIILSVTWHHRLVNT